MHNSTLRGNGRDCLSRKQRHGSQCHMDRAPDVKVTAQSGTVITEDAATLADTPDPNLANNTATVSITVQ